MQGGQTPGQVGGLVSIRPLSPAEMGERTQGLAQIWRQIALPTARLWISRSSFRGRGLIFGGEVSRGTYHCGLK